VPFLWSGAGPEGDAPVGLLLATGILLTLVFTALAFLVSVVVADRARGLGVAILLWLALTVLYDAVLVLVTTSLAEYPLELPLLGLTLLNPVDLGRVLLLLRLDVAALMGYTGAVFERFFGSGLGTALTGGALLVWIAAPLLLGMRRFAARDF
jgi:Cu-processing system permease protein